jgi:hypothetical protein
VKKATVHKIWLSVVSLLLGFSNGVLAVSDQEITSFATQNEASLKTARYMNSECSSMAIAGWEGYDTQACRYSVKDKLNGVTKSALVVLLDPSPKVLSAWILNACEIVRPQEKLKDCGNRLFKAIRSSSSGHFPVAGIVYEDQIPADGVNEAYGFFDGVTVQLNGVTHRRTTPFSEPELQAALNAKPVNTITDGAPARIVGVSRADYLKSYPGVDIAGLKWPQVVREQHMKAMRSDRNALIEAWLAANSK